MKLVINFPQTVTDAGSQYMYQEFATGSGSTGITQASATGSLSLFRSYATGLGAGFTTGAQGAINLQGLGNVLAKAGDTLWQFGGVDHKSLVFLP